MLPPYYRMLANDFNNFGVPSIFLLTGFLDLVEETLNKVGDNLRLIYKAGQKINFLNPEIDWSF